LLRCVLQMVESILQVFRIFKQVEKRFWWSPYFWIKVQK
jgi:hypothetical protein